MAENVTLARPYAEAVFALGRESGSLDLWRELLARLAMLAADEQVKACLSDPRFAIDRVQQLLLESAEVQVGTEQASFIRMLIENDRTQVLPEISEIFNGLQDAHQGVRDALVTSAFPLDDAARTRLQSDLETHFAAKLRIRVELDPALIGGVRIAVGDEVIDASVRGKLAAMTAALKN